MKGGRTISSRKTAPSSITTQSFITHLLPVFRVSKLESINPHPAENFPLKFETGFEVDYFRFSSKFHTRNLSFYEGVTCLYSFIKTIIVHTNITVVPKSNKVAHCRSVHHHPLSYCAEVTQLHWEERTP